MYRTETNIATPRGALGMKIYGLRVYDSKSDLNTGQDYKRYDQLRQQNLPEALELHAKLLGMVAATDVGGRTLADYLYGHDGFFSANNGIKEVMAVSGFLYPSSNHYEPRELCVLGEEFNSIPFIFQSHAFQAPE